MGRGKRERERERAFIQEGRGGGESDGTGISFEEPNPTGSRPRDLIGLSCTERQKQCSVLDAFDPDLKQQSGIPTRVLQDRIQRCTSLPRPPSRLWKQFVSCSVSQFWGNQHLIGESARRRSACRGQ